MSVLTEKLRALGEAQKGTDLGNLLQWAALHIDEMDDLLAETLKQIKQEEDERIKLENALHETKSKMQEALGILQAAWCPPIDFAKDMAPHINLMAGHGDPDYLTKSGMSVRHVDLRTTERKKS